MPYEDIFAAMAHPLRQQILLNLRAAPASVRELTDGLAVSQPVMSQHLKVLRDSGLVSAEPQGMKRLYRIEPQGLEELRRFLETHWAGLLGSLAAPEETP